MFELYKNEIKRLKFWIIIPMLAYLSLNAASIYFGEYADSGLMIGIVHSVFFAVVSLLLGLVQFRAYKKDSRWLYLINRPVSHASLCLTLIAAAATTALFQFVIPDLLITAAMDHLSDFLIEQRHYHQAFYIFLVSMAFYLTGAFIRLCHSKGAFLVVVFPVLIIATLFLRGAVIVVSIIIVLWLMLLVLSVFKANTNNNQTHLWGKLLAVVPFHLGLFLIIGMLMAFSMQMKHTLIDGAGVDISWNEYFADDTYDHVMYLEGHEKLSLNIQGAEDRIQQQYAAQLKHIKTVSIPPEINLIPTQSLFPYQQKIKHLSFVDSVNQIDWVFSFDYMHFLSQTLNSKEVMKLGIPAENGDMEAFKSTPTVKVHSGRTQVITRQHIYFYDADFKTLNLRISVPSDETILSGLYQTGSLMSFVSTKNIYLFNTNDVKNLAGLLSPVSVVKIPGAHENLGQIELAEMMDSTLVSFLFGKNSKTGLFPAEQIVIEIDSSTNQDQIFAIRPLKHGFSEAYHHMDWAISPLTNWFYQQSIKPILQAEGIEPTSSGIQLKLSNQFKLFILFTTLSAVLLTFVWSKKRSVTTIERWSWIGLSCFTGVVGLLTFILLSDKKIILKSMKTEKTV